MRSSLSKRAPARPRTLLAASVLALMPLVAACGDGDDATASTTRDDAPAQSAGGSGGSSGGSSDGASGGSPGGANGGATVSFASPRDGDRIAGSIDLQMVADGVVIEEAGEAREGAGHLHVISTGECVAPGEAIPRDAGHAHFGKGQLEDRLYLPAGTHELCLQVGDGAHIAQPITTTLTVTIAVETMDEWCGVSREIDELGAVDEDPNATIEDLHAAYDKRIALANQLQNRTDLVPEGDRDDVEAMIDGFLELATLVTGSPDLETLEARSEEFFSSVSSEVEAGSDWIDENCPA